MAQHKIYLVHGFMGAKLELKVLHESIEKEGFTSEIFTYRSLKEDVDSVGKMLFDKVRSDNVDSVSFVTHSMGGLVVRAMYEYINDSIQFSHIQRIVMIAPPNNGSPVADFFVKYPFAEKIGGPNLQNLTTDSVSGAKKYPLPKNCEVGIIIGIADKKDGYNVLLKTENDGLVTPESAKIGIEKDIIYVKATHWGLLFNKKVIENTLSFLKNGKFEH
ncbi:lipase [Bacteroidia bacterium]|nr:lipase [Bacteroidia bacterium]